MIVTVKDELRNLDEEFLRHIADLRATAAEINQKSFDEHIEQIVGKITIMYIDTCAELIKASQHGRDEMKALIESFEASDRANGIARVGK